MASTTKIRIRLKAFDHQLLDKSANDIVEKDPQQAKQIARPVCDANNDGRYSRYLNPAKLCDP